MRAVGIVIFIFLFFIQFVHSNLVSNVSSIRQPSSFNSNYYTFDTIQKIKNFKVKANDNATLSLYNIKVPYLSIIAFLDNKNNLVTCRQLSGLLLKYKTGMVIFTAKNKSTIACLDNKIYKIKEDVQTIKTTNGIKAKVSYILIDKNYNILEKYTNLALLKKHLEEYYFLYDVDGFKNRRD